MDDLVPGRIWLERRKLRFYGFEFGTRMTVIRLEDGTLFVHSPVALTDALKREVDGLGPVGHIVSPNKIHHLYMGEWQAAYPEARLYASPGLAKKRPDLNFAAELTDMAAPAWDGQIDQFVFRGSFAMEEVVFFDRPSRTLILADLIEHFCEDEPFLTRLMARLMGMYCRPIAPTDWRMSFRDKETARACRAKLLSYDFERVILAHGRLITDNAKAVVTESFRWLGD